MALVEEPVDLALDADGDLEIVQDVRFTRGLEAVKQSIQIAIRLIRGEWFYDTTSGVPYWERPGVPAADALLGQTYSDLKLLAAIREAILSTPHTVEIVTLSVTFDKPTRTATVVWSVRTTFGVATDETEI
jgi:hypothetical protein